jgi:hypothetical protein
MPVAITQIEAATRLQITPMSVGRLVEHCHISLVDDDEGRLLLADVERIAAISAQPAKPFSIQIDSRRRSR